MMTKTYKNIYAACAFLTALALAGPAHACLSSSEARAVIQSGQAASLSAASRQAVSQAGGQVVKAQLCPSGGGYVYRLQILTGSGAVKQATVDARSGAVLSLR